VFQDLLLVQQLCGIHKVNLAADQSEHRVMIHLQPILLFGHQRLMASAKNVVEPLPIKVTFSSTNTPLNYNFYFGAWL
jgi:hypothetical protein